MSRIITPDEFPHAWLRTIKPQPLKRGNPGKKKPRHYLDLVTAFDIETSRLPEIDQSFMYIWQWQFGLEYTVIGRTWDELRSFIASLLDDIPPELSLVVLVHNLSYEFQFLRTVYNFDVPEVFAVRSRKVLKCTMYDQRLEFRCTYLHSNMSLAMYTRKMGAAHPKLDEAAAKAKYGVSFDYDVIRYPWTELTPMELEYITNDVLGLVESYLNEMDRDGDNLSSIPLTSTGYVRRDAKHAMRDCGRSMLRSMQPDVEIYHALREAFRGGNTHANRYYAGRILDNVKSADRSSSYPDVLVNCQFPITPFQPAKDLSFTTVMELLRRKKAVLLRLAFTGIRQSDPYYGCPYLSTAKCRSVVNGVFDNGRVLAADYLETTLTDIDLRIVLDQYDFDEAVPLYCAYSRYGDLPLPLKLTTCDYYRSKTELKGVKGMESYYDKSKNLLNSIYGMMAQDPVKQSIEFLGGEFVEREDDVAELLMEHNRKAFLCYQWGVWITAWARLRLEEGIRLAGDGFVYCDTDSVKYVGDIDFSAYNAERMAASKCNGAYATDPQGVTHYMGIFEQEDTYSHFSTLGAKKYAYQYEDGATHATISGVSKKLGGKELDRYGGLQSFKPGFVFREAGGTESIYNDFPPTNVLHFDGGDVELGPNVCIKPSTYTLGITAEYERILKNPQLFVDIKRRI